MFTRMAYLACVLVATESSLLGAFTSISTPTVSYTSSTTLMPLTGLPSITSTIFDSGLTINFSLVGSVTSAPAVWSVWSTSPNSESSGGNVPLIAFNLTSTFVMSFSRALSTFGVELQPDAFDTPVNVTATFFNGATQVGQIVRAITTTTSPLAGGARLFAGTSLDQPFTSLQISFNTVAANSDGLGVAYFRYALASQTNPVPEPATGFLALAGLAVLVLRRRS